MKITRLFTGIVIFLVLIAGCAAPPPPMIKAPMDLQSAVKTLVADLFGQVRANQSFISRIGKKFFVVDPFIDAHSAEVNETSQKIEQSLIQQVKQTFPDFHVESMSAKNLAAAQYVINGIIRLDRGSGNGFYRVTLSVVDMKTGIVIANSEVWLKKENIQYEPVGPYKDSPMFLKDKLAEGYIATSLSKAGSTADKDYLETLPTSAVLSEADKIFDAGDFKRALSLYQQAEERPDGKAMKSYSALYQCYFKLGQIKEAEDAFANLLDVGLKNSNLSTRFLFAVNSTDFIANTCLRSQYALWLRQIAKRVTSAGLCLNVTGHTSHSGNERYNEQLSLQRALAVQKIMQKDFPQVLHKTRAYGRGFQENIVGSGSDDGQDAIDRRVVFSIIDCNSL